MFLSYEKCSLIFQSKSFQHKNKKENFNNDNDKKNDDNKVIKKLGTVIISFIKNIIWILLQKWVRRGLYGWLNIITFILKVFFATPKIHSSLVLLQKSFFSHFVPCLENKWQTLERVNE